MKKYIKILLFFLFFVFFLLVVFKFFLQDKNNTNLKETQANLNTQKEEPAEVPTDNHKKDKPPKVDPLPLDKEKPFEDLAIEDIIAIMKKQNINYDKDKAIIINNPSSIFALINKQNLLDKSYSPEDLTIANVPTMASTKDRKSLRAVASLALEDLFAGGLENGYKFYTISGYRSYDLQAGIYQSNVKKRGQEDADKVSARPGSSEHQSGLAMDISTESVDFKLAYSLADKAEGKWLAENAHKYGFIIRYPKDKTHITGYNYEPWHIRFVGKTLASFLYENSLSLEEFCDQYVREDD